MDRTFYPDQPSIKPGREVAGPIRSGKSRSAALQEVLRATDLLAFSMVFLPHFGIAVSSTYAVPFSLLAIYWFGYKAFCFENTVRHQNVGLMFLFTWTICVSWISSASPFVSPLAAGILLAVFTPTVFSVSLTPSEMKMASQHVRDKFVAYTFLLAISGIAQFCLQFVVPAKILFNLADYIPTPLRTVGVWNTVIPIRSFYKANGFFQLEPSGLSGTLAIGLLLELGGKCRPRVLLTMLPGMLLSYSGTGIVVLASGILWTGAMRRPAILYFTITLATFAIAASSALNLDVFVERAGEFGSERSSGYARYVAPYVFIEQQENLGLFDPWFGNGPGAYRPSVETYLGSLGSDGEIHDPSWAKIIFEYGFVGATIMMGSIIARSYAPMMPPGMRITLLVALLVTGGQIAQPNFVGMLYIFLFPWRRIPEPRPKTRDIFRHEKKFV